MKAGILTFHRASNYGTALQAFATIKALEMIGVDAELIDYRPDYIERTVQKRLLRNARSMKSIASILVNRAVMGNAQQKKIQRFLEFFEQTQHSETICDTLDMLESTVGAYDVIISGSDQLWNRNITGDDLAYFFPFSHPRKISYASSFGESELSEERKDQIAPFLQAFSAVSLREEQAASIVRDILGDKQASTVFRVVDPTLLLGKNEWCEYMCPSMELPADGYILTYYMIETPVLRAVTEKLQMETGLPVVNLKPSKRQLIFREGKNLADAGPKEFLSCYACAKYVVTNSFHGTAFAINFSVPMFVAPLPKSMAGEVNSRLVDILSWYGLLDRWISTEEEAVAVDVLKPLGSLEETKRIRREDSIRILKKMLSEDFFHQNPD